MTVNTSTVKPATLPQDYLKEIIELQSVLGSADFDLQAFMNIVVDRVRIFTSATGAVVELVEDDEMVYRAASGSVSSYIGLRLKSATSISGLCVRSGEIAVSNDTSTDSRVDAAACKKINAVSLLVVPLVRKTETVGVLKVVSDRLNAFDEHDVYTLQLLAGLLGGALGQQLEMHYKQKLEEQLRYMAQYDSLTGLPNRALFRDRLAHAIARSKRSDTCLALMYLDIDHFKPVNDTYGHAMGDALLKEFSARIRAIIRESDTFSRLGGDEFVIIAEYLKNKEEAEQIATKIVNGIRLQFELNGQIIKVSTSIGIALSSGKEIDVESFIKQADAALYKVKNAGRNGFEFES